jgi:hypothetical protein
MKTLAEPHVVTNRVAQLGLAVEELRKAVWAGEIARQDCTPLDPVAIPGTEAWRWATRRLREFKVIHGWRPDDRHGFPLVVNPTTAVAVAVSSGTRETGKDEPGKWPTTRNPKGSVVDGIVRQQRRQLLLPEMEESTPLVASPDQNEFMVWFLLVYFDPKEEKAFCELSRPSAIDENGFIEDWDERIILAPVDLEEFSAEDGDGEADSDIDVRVTRK